MKFKLIFTITLCILLSSRGFSQFSLFKEAFHFYTTNQEDAFNFTINKAVYDYGYRLELKPAHKDEDGYRIAETVHLRKGKYEIWSFYKAQKDGLDMMFHCELILLDAEFQDVNAFAELLAIKYGLVRFEEYTPFEREYIGWEGNIKLERIIKENPPILLRIRLSEHLLINSDEQIISEGKSHIIPITSESGVYFIPIEIGGKKLSYIIDTGASDISLPEDVEQYLVSIGALRDEDYLEDKLYSIADGSTIKRRAINIKVLKIGDIQVKNVTASIVGKGEPLLLGNSLLNKLTSWQIDKVNRTLIIEL